MICLPRLLININLYIHLLSATELGACYKQGQRLTIPGIMADIGLHVICILKTGQRADPPPSPAPSLVSLRDISMLETEMERSMLGV